MSTIRISIAAVAAVLAVAACDAASTPEATEPASAEEAVAEAVAEHQARFSAARAVAADDEGTAHAFTFDGLSTPTVPMTAFDGEVVLVVNTASKCGFAPQYEGLQQLYADYREQGFSVLGVPSGDFRDQEMDTAEEIREFCTVNFGVTFPMAARSHVIGDEAHPFYQWAEGQLGEAAVPQWNFHKLLIGRDGRLIAAFDTPTEPTAEAVRAAIEAALAA